MELDMMAAARAAIAKLTAAPQASTISAAPTGPSSSTPGRQWPEPAGGFMAYNWPTPTGIHPDKEARHSSRINNARRSGPNMIRHDIVLPNSDLCKKINEIRRESGCQIKVMQSP